MSSFQNYQRYGRISRIIVILKISTFHEVATDVLKDNRIIENGIRKLTAEVVNECRDKAYRRVAAISARYKEEGNKEYRSLERDERLYKTHDNNFILDEIIWIKSMGLIQKERYFDIDRIGRSKSIRLTRVQRRTIFKIYEEYQEELQRKYYGYLDLEDYALKIIENTSILNKEKLFDYVFVDEVQDLDPMQIYALSLLTKQSIVLSGDAKQRIYKKSPIKYEDIGLNIKEKGKRKVLNKNYRSTAEIVKLANNLVFFDNEDKLVEKQFVINGERPKIYFGKGM
ncbi:MAG: UvrD-helicase domain-containing protein [Sarcina sp.]